MDSLNEHTVALPINNVPDFDLTKIFEWLIASVTVITTIFKMTDAYFANKKRDKQEFIERVVKAAMDSCLSELKQDIHEFKAEMKLEVTKFNNTVIDIYREVKK